MHTENTVPVLIQMVHNKFIICSELNLVAASFIVVLFALSLLFLKIESCYAISKW